MGAAIPVRLWVVQALVCVASGLLACCGEGGGAPGRLAAYDCLTTDGCSRRLVVAHRGYHRESPENSLAAIRATAGVGADLVELDVRHTADGMLVLMHDPGVARTTDGIGELASLTWGDVQGLTLDGCLPDDPERCRVPTFADALTLAKDLGLLVYLDQKTERTDLVLAAIQAGPYLDTVLVRDGWDALAPMLAQEPGLLVMPPIESLTELGDIQAQHPALRIVELAKAGADAETTAAIHAAGVRVQQDVLALGDVPALVGDYTGWRAFVDAGVDVLQTEYPELLVPALRELEETGIFPEEGPPALE